jgi:sulfur-oxidizing protein SoxY
MDSHFVKASGGCSAPASNDQSVEQLRLGRVKLRLLAPITYGQSAPAQLMIRHPNHSGLSKDQLTHLYIPARFIRYIDITYDGRPLINAEVDFTLSENPSLRFHFLPLGAGELRAVVTDSNDLIFQTTTTVREDAVRH